MRPTVPDWAVTFVRKSARGVDPLVVEALARRVAGLVGVFELLAAAHPTDLATVKLRNVIAEIKKL